MSDSSMDQEVRFYLQKFESERPPGVQSNRMMQVAKPVLRRTFAARAAWILCLQFFIAEQVVRLGWCVPYSFARNYISDLGATVCTPVLCSPWHAWMNASFVLQGLSIAGGAWLFWKVSHGLGRAGLATLIVSGAGVLLVGFVPENTNVVVHGVGAAMHFLGGGMGFVLLGVSLRHRTGRATVGLGVVIIAATLLLGWRGNGIVRSLGAGTVERVAAYAIAGWLAVLGLCLRTTSRTSG